MSCYHPILGVPDYEGGLNEETGKRRYKLVGAYDPVAKQLDPNVVAIPCGHCIGCRLDYSRSWADRMMLELEAYKGKAVFITLTYNNEHLPPSYADDDSILGATLYKRDLQLFLKRLRKMYPEKVLRFYASGEYGSLGRPHYHLILFGLGLEDFPENHKIFHGKNELGQPYYEVSEIQRAWSSYSYVLKNGKIERVAEPIGYVCVATVSWQTCAYVSRYVMKKVYHGEQAFIDMYDLQPEFSLMSRRPGIGGTYLAKHPELFDTSAIPVTGMKDPVRIPKYFLKKLEIDNKDKFDIIMSERRKFADDREFLKSQQTSLSYIEQLEVEENVKLSKVKALKRIL